MSEPLVSLSSADLSSDCGAPRSRQLPRGFVSITVIVLLTFYAVTSLSASRYKAQSYDEGEEIAVGYDMWVRRDFRMETANGDLVKRWATLPLLISRPKVPPTNHPSWLEGTAYRFAYEFFFGQGNNPQRILLYCRAMVVLLGVATGLLVFYLSRELFGPIGGLISLTLFVTSPSMLAFGAIVSTEISTCLTLLGAVWSSWRLLQRVTWRTLATSVAFSALLVLSKPTALIMFPLSGLAVTVRLIVKRPLVWEIGLRRAISSRIVQIAAIGGLALIHIVAGWLAIWAAYDFRYAASPNPANAAIRVVTPVQDPIDPTVDAFLHWSQRHHFLPEGYIRGITLLLGQNETQLAFMNGQWKYGGWPTFFPYAILVKTRPALLAAFVLATVAGWRLITRRRSSTLGPLSASVASKSALGARPPPAASAVAGDRAYQATPYVLLVVVYFAVALSWDMNIGFRHVLPIYPPGFVLAGALSYFWIDRRWIARTAVAALLLGCASGPVSIYPHFLAYISPLVGGPREGYKHLVDSSLDWGMDLPGLQAWLARNNPDNRESVFFAYFGVSSPDYYRIKCFRLPSRPEWRDGKSFALGPGIYAISATLLEGVGTRAPGPWNKVYERAWWRSIAAIDTYDRNLKDPTALLARIPQRVWDQEYTRFDQLRFARLCAWLRHHRPPDDNIGYSILIWRLTKEEVFAAGLGPPAELEATPVSP